MKLAIAAAAIAVLLGCRQGQGPAPGPKAESDSGRAAWERGMAQNPGPSFRHVDPAQLADYLALFIEGDSNAFFGYGIIVDGQTKQVVPHATREERLAIAKGVLARADISMTDVDQAEKLYHQKYRVIQ